MPIRPAVRWLLHLAVLLPAAFGPAAAVAQLRVVASQTLEPVVEAVRPVFLAETGTELLVDYGSAPVLRARADAGEPFDVALLTRDALDWLAWRGRVVPSSRVDLARSGLGIAVRADAPLPEVFTTASFKQALLDAPSIMRSADGTSGAYFEALIVQLGIADRIRPKLLARPTGRAADSVALGEAAMAVQQISEILRVPGVRLAGPFPPGLQLYTVFGAAIGTRAASPRAAAALIARLSAPSADFVYQFSALEPARFAGR